jgi:hypothetical protein
MVIQGIGTNGTLTKNSYSESRENDPLILSMIICNYDHCLLYHV